MSIMSILRSLLLAAVLALFAFLAYVAILPPSVTVTRSATIAATPDEVFPHVNDLRKWQAWSPWARRDPDARTTHAGPESGEGSVFRWDGNDNVGKGAMTIVESRPAEHVAIKLEFERPFEDTAMATLDLAPAAGGTEIIWKLQDEQDFFERAILTLLGLDMEEMIGNDYEAGLANLKQVVEKVN